MQLSSASALPVSVVLNSPLHSVLK